MKISIVCGCAVSLFLVGCGETSPRHNAPSGGVGSQGAANSSPVSEAKAKVVISSKPATVANSTPTSEAKAKVEPASGEVATVVNSSPIPAAKAKVDPAPAEADTADNSSQGGDTKANPDDSGIDGFLMKIRNSNPQVASEFEKLLTVARNDIARFGPGHLIFGQVVVEGKNAKNAVVVSQMRILTGGYFVDAVGPEENPIGFRLHSYEPVDVTPKGPGPTDDEDLGIIRMKPLPAHRLASAKGQVAIESGPNAPRLDQVEAIWGIVHGPVNTTHGGTRGSQSVRIKSKVDADGTFSISGMTPARYTLTVRAPNCNVQSRRVEFTEGEAKELEPITLELLESQRINIEFTVSPDCDFSDSKVSKANLGVHESWLSTGVRNPNDEDLFIRQRERQLMLSSSRQPCYIVDLGAAQLDDKRDVKSDIASENDQRDVPVEDGHVYLVHHPNPNFKRWVLFRVTLVDKASD